MIEKLLFSFNAFIAFIAFNLILMFKNKTYLNHRSNHSRSSLPSNAVDSPSPSHLSLSYG